MKQHKISVIMPIYNCELYIKGAIDSILDQTYNNFELLIIDDASTDKTIELVKGYFDVRINLIEKPINTGLTNSLNHGLKIAKGKYIARMDGDDISHPERFAKQVSFLEGNKEIILCGSWFAIVGSDRIIKLPEYHDEIKLAFLKGNCIAHPSVMMRKKALDKFSIVYDVSKEPAEDYDLWVRLMLNGRLHNLQEVLLDYRIHNNQVSQKQDIKQKQKVFEIKCNLFNLLELVLLPDEHIVLNKVIDNGTNINFYDIHVFKNLQVKLLTSNTRNFFEPIGFKKEILDLETKIIHSYFLKRTRFTPKIYFEYCKIKKTLNFRLNLKTEFKLALKAVVFYKS
ncbi:glycosyltransferase family 2 protein [Flavobacterium sp. WC2429]|uniref:Glycosyltransferase family 2 protein n=1 Tax=Flavobacterium sp. WC2429 TaxID=3234140 RepID=A0AB39WLJ8_9FLAO